MPPLRGLSFFDFHVYTDAAETPKQINPTGLKRALKSSRFPRSIRFGWEAEPTGPGTEAVIFSKIDTYGAICQLHLPSLDTLSRLKRIQTVLWVGFIISLLSLPALQILKGVDSLSTSLHF